MDDHAAFRVTQSIAPRTLRGPCETVDPSSGRNHGAQAFELPFQTILNRVVSGSRMRQRHLQLSHLTLLRFQLAFQSGEFCFGTLRAPKQSIRATGRSATSATAGQLPFVSKWIHDASPTGRSMTPYCSVIC